MYQKPPITPDRIKHALCAAGFPETWAEDVRVAIFAAQEGFASDDHQAMIFTALKSCPEINQLLGNGPSPKPVNVDVLSSNSIIPLS